MYRFSTDLEYFALCDTGGKLKIWEIASNKLIQEYVSNSHLTSPPSTFEWITQNNRIAKCKKSNQNDRQRTDPQEGLSNYQIAIGLTNGVLLLYDMKRSMVNQQLKDGHYSQITAITSLDNTELISASEDNFIVEWNLDKLSFSNRWQAGKGKVTALTIIPDVNILITASKAIKLWDLTTKTLITKVTAHMNDIKSIQYFECNNICYLCSAAIEDNYINIWSVDIKNKKCTQKLSLVCTEQVSSFHPKVLMNEFLLVSTLRSGIVQIFKFSNNSDNEKPLKPVTSITVSSDDITDKDNNRLPIVAAMLADKGEVLITYDMLSSLFFEKIMPDLSKKVQNLMKSNSLLKNKKNNGIPFKIKPVETTMDVEYSFTGAITDASLNLKRPKNDSKSLIPLKDRLENLMSDVEGNSSIKGSKKDNTVTHILQALQCKDRIMLYKTLNIKAENTIQNIVKKLPVQAVFPLLKELQPLLEGKTYNCKICIMWIKALLTIHAASIMSHGESNLIIKSMLASIDKRLSIFPDLTKLNGKIFLLSNQIAQRNEKRLTSTIGESLLTYEDEDDNEDVTDNGIDLLGEGSDSDDHWEENSNHNSEDARKSDDDNSIESG